jgi:Icc-related predicted phosphoesterase
MKILSIDEQPFHDLEYRSSGRGGIERRVILPFHRVKVDKLPEGLQSFIAVSDLQGREKDKDTNRLAGQAVVDELLLLQELDEIPKIRMILLAGDLFDYPECHKLGGTGDVTAVWNDFAKNIDFVVGVHGNHDIVQDTKLLPNTKILDGDIEEVEGIQIGGVSGIVGRADRNQRKTDTAFKVALKRACKDETQILLLHQGPDDIVNNQIGDDSIREFLENNGSSIVIFGHCHWSTPFVEIGKHQVLNVDNRLFVFEE